MKFFIILSLILFQALALGRSQQPDRRVMPPHKKESPSSAPRPTVEGPRVAPPITIPSVIMERIQSGAFVKKPQLLCDKSNYNEFIFDREKTEELISKTGRGCQLPEMDFSGMVFEQPVYFDEAYLGGAKFVGTIFRVPASFVSAKLPLADFTGAVIRGDFRWSWIKSAKFPETKIVAGDFSNSYGRGTSFKNAELSGASSSFEYSKLPEADFTGVRITNPRISWNKEGVAYVPWWKRMPILNFKVEYGYPVSSFIEANLQGGKFQNADLSKIHAESLKGTVLRGAQYNKKTKFPKGFDYKSLGKGMILTN